MFAYIAILKFILLHGSVIYVLRGLLHYSLQFLLLRYSSLLITSDFTRGVQSSFAGVKNTA